MEKITSAENDRPGEEDICELPPRLMAPCKWGALWLGAGHSFRVTELYEVDTKVVYQLYLERYN